MVNEYHLISEKKHYFRKVEFDKCKKWGACSSRLLIVLWNVTEVKSHEKSAELLNRIAHLYQPDLGLTTASNIFSKDIYQF